MAWISPIEITVNHTDTTSSINISDNWPYGDSESWVKLSQLLQRKNIDGTDIKIRITTYKIGGTGRVPMGIKEFSLSGLTWNGNTRFWTDLHTFDLTLSIDEEASSAGFSYTLLINNESFGIASSAIGKVIITFDDTVEVNSSDVAYLKAVDSVRLPNGDEYAFENVCKHTVVAYKNTTSPAGTTGMVNKTLTWGSSQNFGTLTQDWIMKPTGSTFNPTINSNTRITLPKGYYKVTIEGDGTPGTNTVNSIVGAALFDTSNTTTPIFKAAEYNYLYTNHFSFFFTGSFYLSATTTLAPVWWLTATDGTRITSTLAIGKACVYFEYFGE